MFRIFVFMVAFFTARSASAGDLEIQPPNIALTGPNGSQRLLVLITSAGKAVSDVTRQAKLTSSNTKVAEVDDEGVVHALDGFQHGYIRQRRLWLRRRKDNHAAVSDCFRGFEYFKAPRRQRDFVRFLHFHAFPRDAPYLVVEVKFRPSCFEHFRGAATG